MPASHVAKRLAKFTATSAESVPEVRRAEDGVRAVEDPAAAAGALGVIHGARDRYAGQQAAQDERQQHAVAPRASVAQVHDVSPWLSLRRRARHLAICCGF